MIKIKKLLSVLLVVCITAVSPWSAWADYTDAPSDSMQYKEYQDKTYTGKGDIPSPLPEIDSSLAGSFTYNHSLGYSLISYYGFLPESSLNPGYPVTLSEALAFLYNVTSKTDNLEQALLSVNELRSKYNLNQIDIWADGYYYLALKDGLISQEQFDRATSPNPELYTKFKKTAYVSKETILVWISKILGIIPSKDVFALKFYSDFGYTSPQNRPVIDSLLQQGISFEAKNKSLSLSANATFRDLFYLAGRMGDSILDEKQLQKCSGTVTIISEGNTRALKINTTEVTYDVIEISETLNFPVQYLGKNLNGFDIADGDFITIYYDNLNRISFAQIHSRSDSAPSVFYATDTVKGTLYFYDEYSKSLVLTKVFRYSYGKWVEIEEKYLEIPLTEFCEINQNGYKLPASDLNISAVDKTLFLTCGRFANSPIMQAMKVII